MAMQHGKSSGGTAPATSKRSATGFAFRRCRIATCVTLVSYLSSISAVAADISVRVTDRDGHGVDQVVVTVAPLAAPVTSLAPKPAVMDQRNLAFVPRILVVGVGARVDFPNNDLVSHQVYSFSAAKRFQLPLYKGEVHPPIVFDRPGLVVLGCNIHDSMVGYIYVTDAPYFGATAADGALELKDIPPGDYRIGLWSPFIADPPAALTRITHLDGTAPVVARIQLGLPLRAQPEPRPHRRDWEY
jgi:plastocyanin